LDAALNSDKTREHDMDTELAPGAYRAVEFDEEAGNTVLGLVVLADDGRLQPLVVEEGYEEELGEIVDDMNAKEDLRVEVAPPEGAEQHQLFRQVIKRGEPLFRQALADYLKKYYGVTLEPAPPDSLPAGVGPQTDYRDDPYRRLPVGEPEVAPDLAPLSPPKPRRPLA
jgi:hypothetical protein